MKKNRGNKVDKYFRAEWDHTERTGHSSYPDVRLHASPVSNELWVRCQKCTYARRYYLYELRQIISKPRLHLTHK